MGKHLDRVGDVLVHKRLYFSDPSRFSDPFDCALGITFPNPEELTPVLENQWKKYFLHLAEVQDENRTLEENQKVADKAFAEGRHKDLKFIQEVTDNLREEIRSIGKETGVLCLTSEDKSVMMWAHYADNHEGLVLRFDTDWMADEATGEKRCFPVDYEKHFPTLDEYLSVVCEIKKGDPIALNKLFFCRKSTEWEGEEERRFFSGKANSHVSFDSRMLDAVIFGWKMKREIKSLIKAWLSNWKTPIVLYDAEPSINKFEMVPKKHK